jgi:hypothetical protein
MNTLKYALLFSALCCSSQAQTSLSSGNGDQVTVTTRASVSDHWSASAFLPTPGYYSVLWINQRTEAVTIGGSFYVRGMWTGQPPSDEPHIAHLKANGGGVASTDGEKAFYRAINVGGAPLLINGYYWEGTTAPNFEIKGSPNGSGTACRNDLQLLPPPDSSAEAEMLRCFAYDFIWGSNGALTNVPAGTYEVTVHTAEDSQEPWDKITKDLFINGNKVAVVYSGQEGTHQRLGPYRINVTDGRIAVTSGPSPGNPLALNGIEVWRVNQ